MAGWTVDWIEVRPATLADSLDIVISNAALGEMALTMPWSDLWPDGVNAQVQIRWRLSGLPEAMPELTLVLK
jgi:hypothetical protein